MGVPQRLAELLEFEPLLPLQVFLGVKLQLT